MSLLCDFSQIKVKCYVLKWFHFIMLYLWKDLPEEFSLTMRLQLVTAGWNLDTCTSTWLSGEEKKRKYSLSLGCV